MKHQVRQCVSAWPAAVAITARQQGVSRGQQGRHATLPAGSTVAIVRHCALQDEECMRVWLLVRSGAALAPSGVIDTWAVLK
jgi:hypothetical protein